MKIYHGSTIAIPEPQLLPTSRSLDFGPGFYATSDWQQARRWAQMKQRRTRATQAIVSCYDAAAVLDANELTIKNFLMADVAWLDFVMAHRMKGELAATAADVIRGPVANDTLYETLALYERGILTQAETIVRLRTHRLADQIVFKTAQALARLRYIGCAEV